MSSRYEFDRDQVAGSGNIITGTAGETIGDRDACYLANDGNYYRADADLASTMPATAISMQALTAGQIGEFLIEGYITYASWTWTTGSDLYVTTAPGALSHTAPTPPDVVQLVGHADSATSIYFNPQGVSAAAGTGETIRVNSGANVGTQPRLNLIEGDATYFTIGAVNDNPNTEVDITYTPLGVGVRERPAAIQGPRNVINLAEGANITITVADNAGNQEVDVTITGATQSGYQDVFYPAPNPDDNKGRHATMSMIDGISTLIRQEFYLPNNYTALWGVDVIVIPDGTGNLRRGVNTHFGAICSGEQYDTHPDTIALGQVAVTNGEIECLDITTALTGAAAGDLVGIEFTRDAVLGNGDTVGALVHYVGVVLRASAPVP